MSIKGSGGSEGGISQFFMGCVMLVGSIWMLLDSTWVRVGHHGYLGRYYGGSMLITLAPLCLGIFMLFMNSKNKIGWIVSILGLGIVILEIISSLRFQMHMKSWQLILLLIGGIGGTALIIKSFRSSK